jgi:hypothetical protein
MKLKLALLAAAMALGTGSGPALAEMIAKEKLAAMAEFLPPADGAKRDQGLPRSSESFSGIAWIYKFDGGKQISVEIQAGKRFVDNFAAIVANKSSAARYGYEVVKIKGMDALFRAKPNKPGIDDDYTVIVSGTRQVIVKASGVDAAALRAFVEKIDFAGIAKAG